STCRDTSFIARVAGAAPPEPLSQGDWRDFHPRRLDGKRILFSSERSGRLQLWAYDLGSRRIQPLGAPGTHEGSASVDGARMVYLDPDRGPGIWSAPVAGGAPRQPTTSPSDDGPQLAFDGERVVFERTEPGRGAQLFVVTPGGEPRALTSAGGEAAAPSPVDDAVVYIEPAGPGGGRVM